MQFRTNHHDFDTRFTLNGVGKLLHRIIAKDISRRPARRAQNKQFRIRSA